MCVFRNILYLTRRHRTHGAAKEKPSVRERTYMEIVRIGSDDGGGGGVKGCDSVFGEKLPRTTWRSDHHHLHYLLHHHHHEPPPLTEDRRASRGGTYTYIIYIYTHIHVNVCVCRGGGWGEVSSGLKYAWKAGGTVSTTPLPSHYNYYHYRHHRHFYHYLAVCTLLLSAPPTPADVRERTRVCAPPAVRARLFKYSV